MEKTTTPRMHVSRVFDSPIVFCPTCEKALVIRQHRNRVIRRLDETIDATLRDKECSNRECPDRARIFRPVGDTLLALPANRFGIDVVLEIGNLRFRYNYGFPSIHQNLLARGLDIGRMSVQYQFRNYLNLISCQSALTDGKLRTKLQKQGVILPIIDGLQFETGGPVLYMIVDSLSGQPLFAQQMLARGKAELVPFIAQLNTIGLPMISIVSDKEKALVPAIAEACPGILHQFCQLHYCGNVAKPMEEPLKKLATEIQKTEENLRAFQREIIRLEEKAKREDKPVAADLEVARELCEVARAAARRYSRGPFDSQAKKRHDEWEKIRKIVVVAKRKKKGGLEKPKKAS